jgi:hypothetical protein
MDINSAVLKLSMCSTGFLHMLTGRALYNKQFILVNLFAFSCRQNPMVIFIYSYLFRSHFYWGYISAIDIVTGVFGSLWGSNSLQQANSGDFYFMANLY